MKLDLPSPITSGELARLLPVLKDSKLEDRASSIFLATFIAVPSFCQSMLEGIGQRIGVKTKISCFTQVGLALPKDNKIRPDGFIRIEKGGKVWTALLEAKIGNAVLDRDQILAYIDLAKQNNVDAIITISNDFTTLPTHHPLQLGTREQKGIELYHWSWLNAVTQALLVQNKNELNNPTQQFVLEEFLRYFEHDSVGVKGFTQMNPEWKDVVQKILHEATLKKNSEEVINTISAWHQESRDLCLIMSRELGVPVKERIARKHVKDSAARIKDDADTLITNHELLCVLDIPDTASALYITANLRSRSISCEMRLEATQDPKTNKAQITWLVKQLTKTSDSLLRIRAWHRNVPQHEQATLGEIREEPQCLISDGKEKILFSRFEVAMVRDLAGKFSGTKVFIQNLEEIAPRFYAEVGQHLRAWVKPAPKPQQKEDNDDQIAAE